ncbi:glycosyltransferase family 4 protein [Pseudomonas sp. UM16]|uniref:glycosyltransferase family 4 protein n=1 Tax=Pseudomonas sp. UM16 TaxID=3158962 RepID=UPI00398FFCD9
MKVLFQSRVTLFSSPGGDTTQILKTAEYLRKLAVEVDVTTELEPDVSQYDLVHVFNLRNPQEIYLQIKNAKSQGKPVALSTIWGEYVEYDRYARGGIYGVLSNILGNYTIEYCKVAARALLNREYHKGTVKLLTTGYHRLQLKACSMVDVFLPNSESEMRRVEHDMNLVGADYVSVPNAVDVNVFNYDSVAIPEKYLAFDGCLLSAARIEGRKCQLQLVRAMEGLPYKLVIVGKPGPNALKYYQQCLSEAPDNVHFIDYLPHDELPALYKVAKAHALVSWMETPGLSSLEAAAMKCNLLITEKGDTRDYFGEYARYCDPSSVQSIRQGVVDVMQQEFDQRMRDRTILNYTWDKTAEATLQGYKKAIAKSKVHG